MPLILALARQRQADLFELEASQVHKAEHRTVRATQRNPVSEKQNQIQKQTKKPKYVSKGGN